MLFPGSVTIWAPAGLAREGWKLRAAVLARGQRLHVQGVVGVLGGRAEPLVKANQRRQAGQNPRAGTSSPEANR